MRLRWGKRDKEYQIRRRSKGGVQAEITVGNSEEVRRTGKGDTRDEELRREAASSAVLPLFSNQQKCWLGSVVWLLRSRHEKFVPSQHSKVSL